MNTRLTAHADDMLVLEIEELWEALAEDYKDACKLYQNAPILGYPPGQVPDSVLIKHYGQRILATAAKTSSQRLAREAMLDARLHSLGPVIIRHGAFMPGQSFQITVEINRRLMTQIPEYADYTYAAGTLAAAR